MAKLRYTTIHYQALIDYDISCNEYVILDTIHNLCRRTGWCILTRENMAKNIGATKQAVINIVDRLIEREFLVKNEKGNLATTDKWIDPKIIYEENDGKESLPSGYKKFTEPVKKVYRAGKESLPNNTIYNNSNNKDNNISIPLASPHDLEIPDFEFEPVIVKAKSLHLYVKKSDAVGDDVLWKLDRFYEFWERFKKKKSAAKVKTKWLTLKREEIETILNVVDDHVLIFSVREFQFRPHPITWLNQRCWEDDISEELKKLKPRSYPKRETNKDDDWN